MKSKNNIGTILNQCPRSLRKIIFIIIDSFIILFSTYLYLFLFGSPKEFELNILTNYKLYSKIILIGLSVYILTGQYKSLTRYIGSINLYKIAIRNVFFIVLISFLNIIDSIKVIYSYQVIPLFLKMR